MRRYVQNSQAKLDGIETGSQVLKVNGVNVGSCKKNVVLDMFRNSIPPCTVEFSMKQVVPDEILHLNDHEDETGEHKDGEFKIDLDMYLEYRFCLNFEQK